MDTIFFRWRGIWGVKSTIKTFFRPYSLANFFEQIRYENKVINIVMGGRDWNPNSPVSMALDHSVLRYYFVGNWICSNSSPCRLWWPLAYSCSFLFIFFTILFFIILHCRYFTIPNSSSEYRWRTNQSKNHVCRGNGGRMRSSNACSEKSKYRSAVWCFVFTPTATTTGRVTMVTTVGCQETGWPRRSHFLAPGTDVNLARRTAGIRTFWCRSRDNPNR